MIEIIAGIEQAGNRLDKVVASLCTDLSRSMIQKLILGKNLTINDRIVTDCSYQVKLSENIILDTSGHIPVDSFIAPKEISLDIAFEDENLMVINKSSGLTVHPGAGTKNDTLVNALAFYLGDNLSDINGPERPGIVHRLDRNTTGLLIVAKNNACHSLLGQMMQDRLIKREYVAFTYGVLRPSNGKIEANIIRNQAIRTAMRTTTEGGKYALTYYKTDEVLANGIASKITCNLATGRTHQIRVHMLHKKCPIIGDGVYGRSQNRDLSSLTLDQQSAILNFPRQALHAAKLSFIHPITHEELNIEAPLPKDMADLYNALKI
jgi:23S rRNA pseudouridine1911/1915/1917 synthase